MSRRYSERFGTWLRGRRKAANMTLRHLAKFCRVSHGYFAEIENNRKPPPGPESQFSYVGLVRQLFDAGVLPGRDEGDALARVLRRVTAEREHLVAGVPYWRRSHEWWRKERRGL